MNRYAYQPRRRRAENGRFILARAVFILFIFTALAFIFVNALDRTFENQDRMNCNSAKVSGNREWLAKCQCYYDGASISCIRKEETND